MNRFSGKLAVALLSASILTFSSCNSDEKKDAPAEEHGSSGSMSKQVMTPGEAGGTEEDTFTATTTVTAIDPAKREITLTGEENRQITFICGPEIKNFDQLKVGDKVTAEITEKLAVFVRSDEADPTVTHIAALATAPKGAKPGVMVGQTTEITAKVKSIDTDARKATLEFFGGETRTVNVRSDVDLSKYKVGDTVVIRLTEAISILTKAS
jgi:Cu/Ag efflux protein CusF